MVLASSPVWNSLSTMVSGGLVVAIAACGSVKNQDRDPTDAAVVSDGPSADAWAMNCVAEAVVARVESTDSGYGGNCVHGTWVLEALNGTTVPSAPDQAGHAAAVHPTAITLGSNPLDPGSTFAVHVSGIGQEDVGTTFSYAQLNAPLNRPSASQVGSVDASAYTGIQFYAKISTGTTGLRLTVANLYTDPAGGMCAATGGGPTACYDHPGAQIKPPMTGSTTDWNKYQIAFKDLVQLNFGNPSPIGDQFPRSAITLIKWDLGIPSSGPTAAWDLWVDDVTFY